MAYRSWLKDVKRLEDLGNHLVDKLDSPQWEKLEERATERWFKKLKEPVPVDEPSAQFFGSRLHDSWVLEVTRSKNQVTIKVHDFLAQVFAEDLCQFANVSEPEQTYPVHLVFHDVDYANGFRTDPNRMLRHSDWLGAYEFDFNFNTNSGYGHDWFFQQDGRLQWVGVIYHWQKSANKLNPLELYIVIDCAKATALDLREQGLAKHFPPEAMQFWKDIVNKVDFPQPYGLEGSGLPLDYILRRLDKYNLTQDQLAKSIKDFRASNP